MTSARSAIALALALALVLVVDRPAGADYVLGFGQGSYLSDPGGQVAVDLFLIEDAPGTVLSDGGLLSAAFRLLINEEPRTSSPATVAGVDANLGFDVALTSIVQPTATATGEVEFILDALLVPPVFPDASSPGRIRLATVTFQVGAGIGSVTNLGLEVFAPGLDNFAVGPAPGTVIPDAAIAGSTATIVAIPEPASLALTGFGLGTGIASIAIARRRRARMP